MAEKKHIVCPASASGTLDNLFRRLIHNPKKLFVEYIKPGMKILDVGCGSGFFSRGLAEMVREPGIVIAADLQQKMLDKLQKKIASKKIKSRIKLHKCEKDKIGLKEKVDFVLAFYMVHEVPDKIRFFREIKSILDPDGTLYIAEPNMHVSKKEFEETIRKAVKIGFKEVKRPKLFLSRAVVLKRI